MTTEEQRNIMTGIMGTVAFHLILAVAFFTFKLGEVNNAHAEIIEIEFSDQDFKTLEEIIEEQKPKAEAIQNLSADALSNIISNTAEKMDEQISTDKYIQELMEELGMEEINPQHDNSLPEEEVYNSVKKDDKPKEQKSVNYGQTRISYHVPGRKGTHIERPIYRCEGGGTVEVSISVNQSGYVEQAQIASATTNDDCVKQMALQSARKSRFNSDNNAAKKVVGSITYVFVAQ